MPRIGDRFNPRGFRSSVWIPHFILSHPSLSAGAKLCYGKLVWHCGEKDYCWPGQQALAEELKVTVRAIQTYLSELASVGLIEVERRGLTQTNVYHLLWTKEMEEAFFMPDTNETSHQDARCEQTFVSDANGCSCQVANDCSPHIGSNKREVMNRKYTPYSPPIENFSSSSLDLDDPIETFLVNAWSRVRRVRLKLNRKSDAATVERCRELDAAHPAGEFRRAALLFLESESGYLRQFRWPIQVFLSQVGAWLDRASETVTDTPSHALAPAGEAAGQQPIPQGQSPATDAPSGLQSPPSPPSLPAPCQEWNRVVTAGDPVEDWTRHDVPLQRQMNDPDFVASLPKILEIAQSVCLSGGSWKPTFRWLLRTGKDGVVNWHKLLTEGRSWARPRQGANRKFTPEFEAYLDNLLKEEDNADNRSKHQAD